MLIHDYMKIIEKLPLGKPNLPKKDSNELKKMQNEKGRKRARKTGRGSPNKQGMPSKIDPPCIGICTINENGVCIGCNRTVKEIHEAYLESIGMKNDKQ